MVECARVTGITSQDGACLATRLVAKGHEVTGIVGRPSHARVADHRLRWIGDVRRVDACAAR